MSISGDEKRLQLSQFVGAISSHHIVGHSTRALCAKAPAEFTVDMTNWKIQLAVLATKSEDQREPSSSSMLCRCAIMRNTATLLRVEAIYLK